MWELMITKSQNGIYVPDSGPGSKYIRAGTTELGFMGEVPESELVVEGQLLALAAPYQPYDLGKMGSPVWLKYIRKGKVIFFPLYQFPALTMNSMSAMQATFDAFTTDPALKPATIANGAPMYPVNSTVNAKNGDVLSVRLLSASDTTTRIANTTDIQNCEYFDIVTAIYDPATPSPIGYKRNIDEVVFFSRHPDTPAGAVYVMQMSTSVGSVMWGSFVNAQSLHNISASPPTNYMRWLPILEYIPSSVLANYALKVEPVIASSLAKVNGYSVAASGDGLVYPGPVRSTGQVSTALVAQSSSNGAPTVIAEPETSAFYNRPKTFVLQPRIVGLEAGLTGVTSKPTRN